MFHHILFSLFCSLALGNEYLSCSTYDDAYRAVDHLISKNEEFIPPLVRLGFHDCVGKSCDGCLNYEDKSNKGLVGWVEKLDEIYEHKFHKELSRADFWQLASQVALVRAGLNRKPEHKHDDTFLNLQFWWGRKDCKTSPNSHHDDDTGNGLGDYHEVERVLTGNFKLNHKEIVAAMGAHNVGGGHKKTGSGFDYNWQREHLCFDNKYYKNLIHLPYTHEDVTEEVKPGEKVDPHAPERLQFAYVPENKHEDPLLMLNVDMSLWKELKAEKKHGEFTGEVSCPLEHHHKKVIEIPEGKEGVVEHCEDAKETSQYVYKFASHLDAFYESFEDAWWKIVTNGCDDLHLPGIPHKHEHCGNCIPHGAYCVSGFEHSGKCCPGSHCVHNKCV